MTNVSITLTGANKENVQYVTLGGKRWGLNGEDYGTQQVVDSGSQDWKVGIPRSEADGEIDVPDDALAVMTVDAKQDEVTVSF